LANYIIDISEQSNFVCKKVYVKLTSVRMIWESSWEWNWSTNRANDYASFILYKKRTTLL